MSPLSVCAVPIVVPLSTCTRREARVEWRHRRNELPSAPTVVRGDEPPPLLPPGTLVVIGGLRAKPDLNGTTARIVRYEAASSRYAVQRQGDGSVLALKRSNLHPRKPPVVPLEPRWHPSAKDGQSIIWLMRTLPGFAKRAPVAPGQLRFAHIEPASWRTETPPPPPDRPRWAPELCGGSVQEVDMRSEEGRAAAYEAVAARRPVVMRHAAEVLQPEVSPELADMDRVSALLRGLDVTVLRANAKTNNALFTYYQPNETAASKAAGRLLRPPEVNDRLLMKWEEFADILARHTAERRRHGSGKRRAAAAAGGGGALATTCSSPWRRARAASQRTGRAASRRACRRGCSRA